MVEEEYKKSRGLYRVKTFKTTQSPIDRKIYLRSQYSITITMGCSR
jgi:hypothetical protein